MENLCGWPVNVIVNSENRFKGPPKIEYLTSRNALKNVKED